MQTLTADELLDLIKNAPEKSIHDWKQDFTLPNDDEKKGEFLKDLAAMANTCDTSYGYIIYGVNRSKPDPIIGISNNYDDAKLQQLVKGKINPLPNFLYYEISIGAKKIGVLQISPNRQRPHIISVNMGKVREGQILLRRGTCTEGANLNDLFEFFYGQNSSYFANVIKNTELAIQKQMADIELGRYYQEQADNALKDMEMITGIKLR